MAKLVGNIKSFAIIATITIYNNDRYTTICDKRNTVEAVVIVVLLNNDNSIFLKCRTDIPDRSL